MALAGWSDGRLGRLRVLCIIALLIALLSVVGTRSAQAAACCLSASVFGIGRLAIWETAAFGALVMGARDSGRWDKTGSWRPFPSTYQQDELRTDLWGILRLHERAQLSAKAPWVTGIRAAQGVPRVVAGGLGDVAVALRWDAILAGEFKGWPAITVTATGVIPMATRVEETADLLGAGTTGRGAWVGGLALAVEKAVLPWFARADLGFTLPAGFERRDTGVTLRYGPGWQAGLSAGRELVPDRIVLGAQAVFDREAPYTQAGVEESDSGTRGLNAGLSLSWRFADVWTATAAASSDAPSGWLGPRNRTERWSATMGIRYAIQE
jgi:hypothetical protein